MSEPAFTFAADDDLPRTLRREREARERQAREQIVVSMAVPADERSGFAFAAPAATVTDFDVPFAKLVGFFLKAVLAGIPALLLLTTLLWLVGQGLQTFFPQLLKLKVLIYLPQ
jgi:hypothetical protein